MSDHNRKTHSQKAEAETVFCSSFPMMQPFPLERNNTFRKNFLWRRNYLSRGFHIENRNWDIKAYRGMTSYLIRQYELNIQESQSCIARKVYMSFTADCLLAINANETYR